MNMVEKLSQVYPQAILDTTGNVLLLSFAEYFISVKVSDKVVMTLTDTEMNHTIREAQIAHLEPSIIDLSDKVSYVWVSDLDWIRRGRTTEEGIVFDIRGKIDSWREDLTLLHYRVFGTKENFVFYLLAKMAATPDGNKFVTYLQKISENLKVGMENVLPAVIAIVNLRGEEYKRLAKNVAAAWALL